MKLVILQQDAHKRRIKKKEVSTKIKDKTVTKTTKTKEKDATLLKKTQMTMTMK